MSRQNPFARGTGDRYCSNCPNDGPNNCNDQRSCCDDKEKNPCVVCPPGPEGPQGPVGDTGAQGPQGTELCETLLALDKKRPEDIFGYVDAKKLQSSMTLFALADQENPIFGRVLARFYAGGRDGKTLALLGKV